MAALTSFWAGTAPERHGASCALWLARVTDDPDDDTAGLAAHYCSLYSQDGGCQAQWDALLSAVERKAKEGKIRSAQHAAALGNVHKQQAATAAQKQRALEVAKAIVQNQANSEPARALALDFVGEKDSGAEAFAKKFKDDASEAVRGSAKRILEPGKAAATGR